MTSAFRVVMIVIGESGEGLLLLGWFGPLFRGGERRGGRSMGQDWRRRGGRVEGEGVEVFGFRRGGCGGEADEAGYWADVWVGFRRGVEEWFSFVEEVWRGAEVVSGL